MTPNATQLMQTEHGTYTVQYWHEHDDRAVFVGYRARVRELPGVWAEGDDFLQAQAYIRAAIAAWHQQRGAKA